MVSPRPINGSPPKVVHLVASLETGGLERFVLDLATARGAERTTVLCLQSIGPFGEALRQRGFQVDLVGMQGGKLATLVRLRAAVHRHRADILHCHNMLAFRYGGLVARSCGMPGLILTKHGMTVSQIGMGARLDRWLARRATIIAVSSEVEQLMSEWSPLGGENVRYVPNGLDLGPFVHAPSRREARIALGFHDDDRLAGIVARLSPEKDHATLLEAFARVVGECPRAKLLLVGDGPLRNAIQATIQRLGLHDSVLMLGERHDVPLLLAALDVFVLSSTTEGMPMTVLEAMASGLPVVATRVGGVPAVVTHAKTGLLVEPGSADQLASPLISLLSDEGSAHAMGSSGRDRVEQDFDVRITVDRYEAMYIHD